MNFNMSSEKQFSTWLMKRLNERGHAQRIETTTGNGVPDINWAVGGKECWIETKIGCLDHVLLRKEQFAWGTRRIAAGGNVRVFAYCPAHDNISIFVFPLLVKVHGKYLRIVSEPYATTPRSSFKLV